MVVDGVSSFDTLALSHVFHSTELAEEKSRLWAGGGLYVAESTNMAASPWLSNIRGGELSATPSCLSWPVLASSVVAHE